MPEFEMKPELSTKPEISATDGDATKKEHEIKQEQAAPNYLDFSIENVNSKTLEELQDLFSLLQEQFKASSAKLEKTRKQEQYQRTTMAYYQRRNDALLNILDESGLESQTHLDTDYKIPNDDEKRRIDLIIERVPRIAKTLKPLAQDLGEKGNKMTGSFTSKTINSNHFINMYLLETIPDLADDDLMQLEVNPQEADSWCRRNLPNLVNAQNVPITLDQILQMNQGQYAGVDFDLGIDGKLVLSPMAANTTGRKRRRR
ncbi:hypothetical protein LELG_03323 [Lodderomyces elongisporus NRRL YB-4239]|uniref:Uncharacterized protein n=1 Tax=Lodderomyces elongisporus (strain ATCC 11503 / CBS 2605 / JCM 1781 / NBRC 1676 / NRRL YB-4239) TaxID=379508 RepID=A5E136_LODEL|nr:hypothetical protein LELG_03323 [Lodderomyces elongisporus NRRL YB-4239]